MYLCFCNPSFFSSLHLEGGTASIVLCSLKLCYLNIFTYIPELTLNPPEGIIAGPINEENFFEWEALIT